MKNAVAIDAKDRVEVSARSAGLTSAVALSDRIRIPDMDPNAILGRARILANSKASALPKLPVGNLAPFP